MDSLLSNTLLWCAFRADDAQSANESLNLAVDFMLTTIIRPAVSEVRSTSFVIIGYLDVGWKTRRFTGAPQSTWNQISTDENYE